MLSQTCDDLERLFACRHYDPHGFLGPHEGKYIRLFRPGYNTLEVCIRGQLTKLVNKCEQKGLFELETEGIEPFDYLVEDCFGNFQPDPYAFAPTFTELDQYLFAQGVHYDLYKKMGARKCEHQSYEGYSFTVWAPEALAVSLVGDFNSWDGRMHPMRVLGKSGVWELFIPGMRALEKYKFEIHTKSGECLLKADPFALQYELRPATASITCDSEEFLFSDHEWLDKRRASAAHTQAMNVYEVHLGSWNWEGKDLLNYREIAHRLAEYCQYMGFTHVELLPPSEHPLDESWGYQVTGYFAPTSRFGSFQDFQYFIDHLHQKGIGIIVDWVPAHFPIDDFALAAFDSSCLFEHADPRQGYHPHWHTLIFNYGRKEVTNFLIASALFWVEKMHVDALRVDAVASMLYLDYGRKEGEWIPNGFGGKENLEAIEFLKHLNSVMKKRNPGSFTIAEESTSFPGVTKKVEEGGLGFDLKWNMGWMNDTLRYFSKDPIYRPYHHGDLTFGLLYAFSECFQLVLSHDEVVHGKKSLLSKMPGDSWQQFANLRLLLSYMYCQPGKNLLFMGGEFAQEKEWSCKEELHWYLLEKPLHKGMQDMVRCLNHLVLQHNALWERDFSFDGFEWVDYFDTTNSVVIYRRHAREGQVICIHHFTPTCIPKYWVRAPVQGTVQEIFNSDAKKFGGSGKAGREIQTSLNGEGFFVDLPPLATMILIVS